MTENDVNIAVRDWLLQKGFNYKGILNAGKGQVAVPDGYKQVLIDHMGVNDKEQYHIWVEAKGSDVGLSRLLEGFLRVQYAVWYGAGKGYLAVPHKEYGILLEQKEFLEAVSNAVNGKGLMGLLDIEKGNLLEF